MSRREGLRTWFRLRPHHARAPRIPWLANYFADRGTHLAAMIAYYALLSFVPLLFLLLSSLQFVGQQTESSFLVRQLRQALPGQSVADLVRVVNELRSTASTLGLIGLIGLLWSALGLLSAIASALNIIYEVPNGSFLRQKGRILLLIFGSIVGLFIALTAVTALAAWAAGLTDSVLGLMSPEEAIGVAFTACVTTVFLFVVYRYIPNAPMTAREVLPGVAFGAVAFQASFQATQYYVRAVETIPSLKALGGFAVLLIWFYLMGNILLIGAEINWWYGRGRNATDGEPIGLA